MRFPALGRPTFVGALTLVLSLLSLTSLSHATLLHLDASALGLSEGETVTNWGAATASGTPTYRTDQSPNGNAAVEFNDSDHFGELAATLFPASATGDFIIAAVIKPTNTGAYHNVIDIDVNENGPMLWIDPSFNYELNKSGGNGAKGAGTGVDGWDVLIADSRTNNLYINSATANATGSNSVPYSSAKAFDLFNRDDGQTFQGLVAELRVYNDAASFGNDFGALYNELNYKWIVVDDTDGDKVNDAIDNCPYRYNDAQTDTGGVGVGSSSDGIGDACQCGDVDDDGYVTQSDGDRIKDAALSLDTDQLNVLTLPGFEKCDVGGTPGCTGLDGTLLLRAVLGLPPALQQECPAAKPNSNNLKPVSISLVAPGPLQIGHPAEIQLSIDASEPISNVSVQIVAVDKLQFDAADEDDPNPTPIETQFVVGAAVVNLDGGGQQVEVQITIPETDLGGNPIQPGTAFYLYPQIDPGEEIAEFNEEDNVLPDTEFATIEIADLYQNTPSIVLESLAPDMNAIDLPEMIIHQVLYDLGVRSDPPEPEEDCVELPDPRSGSPNIPIPCVPNSSLGMTAVLSTSGPPVPRIEFSAELTHPQIGAPISLVFWDGIAGSYQPTLSVPAISPDEPTSVHLDVRLRAEEDAAVFNQLVGVLAPIALQCYTPSIDPPHEPPYFAYCPGMPTDPVGLGQCLATCVRANFTSGGGEVIVEVAGFDAMDQPLVEYEPPAVIPAGCLPGCTNIVSEAVAVTTPDPPPVTGPSVPVGSREYGKSYLKNIGGDFASAGVDAEAKGQVSAAGAVGEVHARLPVSLFSYHFKLLELDAVGKATDMSASSCFALSLKSTGIERFYLGFNNDCEVPPQPNNAVQICQGFSACEGDPAEGEICIEDGRLLWRMDWFAERSEDAQRDFVIGVVPLTATFEAAGKVGFLVEEGVPVCNNQPITTLEAKMGPYAEVDMAASAGVGTGAGFSAGMGGESTLISDTFFASAVVDLNYTDYFPNIRATLTEDITNELAGPEGSFYLFVKYPCVKWCKKRTWFGKVSYPCGFKQCQQEQPITSFSSFIRRDVLISESVTTDILR